MSRVVVAGVVIGISFTSAILIAEDTLPISNLSDISVELSLGDFVDKMIILEIKNKRITDPVKLKNVNAELASLRVVFYQQVARPVDYENLYKRLFAINERLWELEDLTRLKECAKQFDDQFASYVKDIINTNDERARVKHELNVLLESGIVEEKSYVELLYCAPLETTFSSKPIMITAPAPLADIADRITILKIKAERINDPEKLVHINQELALLSNKFYAVIQHSPQIAQLMKDLYDANAQMWDIQDGLRAKRRMGQFDNEFIQFGRAVYYANDKRTAAKRSINQLLGSRFVEEKCYAAY